MTVDNPDMIVALSGVFGQASVPPTVFRPKLPTTAARACPRRRGGARRDLMGARPW
jgi:hypothetical protein